MEKIEKGINSFQLKCVALIFMTLDHIGVYLCSSAGVNNISILRIVGRIAAPLFLYVTVNSIAHTRSKLKYARRLYVAHVLIGLLTLFFTTAGKDLFGMCDQFSILSTFVYVVLIVYIIETIRNSQKSAAVRNALLLLSMIGILVIPVLPMVLWSECEIVYQVLLPNILTVPYSFLFVCMGVCWYFVRSKKGQIIILALFSFLSFAGAQIMNASNVMIFTGFFNTIQCFMILCAPFIYYYDGTRGRSMKYFFYLYYPAHVFILMFLEHQGLSLSLR